MMGTRPMFAGAGALLVIAVGWLSSGAASTGATHGGQWHVTTRASVTAAGDPASSGLSPMVSTDGRFVAFVSFSTDIVAGDTNNYCSYTTTGPFNLNCIDTFVYDRDTGAVERASLGPGNQQLHAPSLVTGISPDGRYVSFTTASVPLAQYPSPGAYGFYLRDRETQQTTEIRTEPSNGSAFSADGRYVAFSVTDGVYVRDLTSGSTTLVSLSSTGEAANDATSSADISGDGNVVVFSSTATNLVDGDTNDCGAGYNCNDVYAHNIETGDTVRVSVASDGTQANGYSGSPAISDDGRYVVFESSASNLVPDDTNGERDIFMHDLQTGATTRLSVASGGAEANESSALPTISGDGRFVAFQTKATNLVPGDTNYSCGTAIIGQESDNCPDIVVRELQSGEMSLASVAADGTQGDGASATTTGFLSNVSLNGDGSVVVFNSAAHNLIADAGTGGAFLAERSEPPTPTPAPGDQRNWGDVDCSTGVNSVDALKVQRHVAALSVPQTEPCPDIGSAVDVAAASPHAWGDTDCDGDVDSVDALKLLRHVAALPVSQQEPCPDIGTEVLVSEP